VALRRVTIRSADGKPIELKNPQSTLKGIKVELVAKEADKVFELVARLDEVPPSTVSGNVSFETSVAGRPKIEVPVIVNVFKAVKWTCCPRASVPLRVDWTLVSFQRVPSFKFLLDP